jgi:hypothetical protein
MPSVRCMDRSLDTNAKREAHQIAILCITRFCRVAKDPKVFGRLQEAFVYTLRDYVEYALLGEPKHAAQKLDETEKLIARAKRMGELNEDRDGAEAH